MRNFESDKLTNRRNISLYNSHKRNFTFYNKMMTDANQSQDEIPTSSLQDSNETPILS